MLEDDKLAPPRRSGASAGISSARNKVIAQRARRISCRDGLKSAIRRPCDAIIEEKADAVVDEETVAVVDEETVVVVDEETVAVVDDEAEEDFYIEDDLYLGSRGRLDYEISGRNEYIKP